MANNLVKAGHDVMGYDGKERVMLIPLLFE